MAPQSWEGVSWPGCVFCRAVGPHSLPGASGPLLRRVVAAWTDITLRGSGRTDVSRLTDFLGDVNILRH